MMLSIKLNIKLDKTDKYKPILIVKGIDIDSFLAICIHKGTINYINDQEIPLLSF